MRAKSPRPGRSAPDLRHWYERHPMALEAVRRIASEHASSLVVRIDGDQGVVLEGKLRYAPMVDGGTPEFVRVEVVLSPYHPAVEPSSFDADSRFPRITKFHKFSGSDRLCLWLPPESEWRDDDESLRTYLDQLVVHVHRQLLCEADPTHKWPAEERAHTYAGAYSELLVEALGSFELAERFVGRWRKGEMPTRNDWCPCGSGKKWKRCHLEEIEAFERRCGRNELRAAYRQRLEGKREAS